MPQPKVLPSPGSVSFILSNLYFPFILSTHFWLNLLILLDMITRLDATNNGKLQFLYSEDTPPQFTRKVRLYIFPFSLPSFREDTSFGKDNKLSKRAYTPLFLFLLVS